MKKKWLFSLCMLFAVLTAFLSCSKDDDSGYGGEFIINGKNAVGVWKCKDVNQAYRYSNAPIWEIYSNGKVTLFNGKINDDGYVEVTNRDYNEAKSNRTYTLTVEETRATFDIDGVQYRIYIRKDDELSVVQRKVIDNAEEVRHLTYVRTKGIKRVN